MSEHWYSPDGSTAYTYTNAKGKESNTTLREARKFGYWPSVTTIIGCAAAPGLDNYKQEQILQAAWKWIFDEQLGFNEDCYDIFKRVVVQQSKKHRDDAAKRGSNIHDMLEKFYKTPGINDSYCYTADPMDSKDLDIVSSVIQFLEKQFPNAQWQAEKSFCHTGYGFGGKVDLHDPVNKIVLDFKTKDTDDVKKMVAYNQHHMQSAAYSVGLSYVKLRETNMRDSAKHPEWHLDEATHWKRYNLFISTQIPGLLNLTESTNFDRDWIMFRSLLDYWKMSNDHYPEKYRA